MIVQRYSTKNESSMIGKLMMVDKSTILEILFFQGEK